jgi:hypothetical protein
MSRRVVLLVLELVLVSGVAHAEIPQVISYQGKVTDAVGNPVADGSYTMRFRIYDAVTGESMLWDSGAQSVSVTGGIFSILLGENPPPAITLDFTADYWLLVTFSGVEQSPRQRLASTSYAYMASGLVAGTEVVGSITSSPYAAIKGTNTATSGSNYGLYGWSSASAGGGVYGYATTGTSSGVHGYTRLTAGRGVSDHASSVSASDSYGGYFTNASDDGTGAYGEGGWIGVRGVATQTSGMATGVYGETSSSDGMGIQRHATSTVGNAQGARFQTRAPDGVGV